MYRRGLLQVTIAAPAALAASGARGEQDGRAASPFPTRPVRVVLGVAPGIGTIDLTARAAAEPMAEVLGQPVVVENRPGAGGILATEAVARAPADGHTLFLGGVDAIVSAFVMAGRPPLDPFTDFTPIGRATRDHWMVVVSPTLGVGTVDELAELGRRSPGTLTYASFGVGTTFHLLAASFCRRLRFEALHVPYRGDYTPDLLAGRISFLVQPTALLLPHVVSGRLRALAVLSPERLPALADVLTIGEADYPDLVFNAGIVLFAPGGTPPDAVARLNAALNHAARSPAVRGRLADLTLETVEGTPDDAAAFIRWNIEANDHMRAVALGPAR